MAKIKGATITFEVTDDGSLKMLDTQAKKTGKSVAKVGKSAGDTRRNMQAMSGRVESGTKGFARMQQGTGGLVQSYAILASTLFAVGAAFRALQNAANVENQIKGFRALGEITGQSMMGVTASVRQATGGLLNFQDAAQQAAIGMAAGFTSEQLTGLAEGAKLASVTLGRDLTDSFNRLIRGVTKAEPELLDELGIILRLDIATRKFANANGLVAEKLTIAQRRAAVFEEVQRQLIGNFGAMKDKGDELLNPFDRLLTKINDFVISVQGPIVKVFGGLANFLSDNFAALVTAVSAFALSILRQIVPSFSAMGAAAVKAGSTATIKMRALNIHIIKQKKAIKAVEAQFGASEVKKNQFLLRALKKRGISEKAFTSMSLKEQAKITRSFILQEEKKKALGKKYNKQKLAAFIAVEKRIQLEMTKTTLTAKAQARIIGAHIKAGIAMPALKAQAAIAGIGAAAARAGPAIAMLGTAMNIAFGVIMAFFTAKFILDLLPATKKINEAFSEINRRVTVSNEVVKDLAYTLSGDLAQKRVEAIKEEFVGLEGSVKAANYEMERLNNILNRGQSFKTFKKNFDDSIIKNFSSNEAQSMLGNVMQAGNIFAGMYTQDVSASSIGFTSTAYDAAAKEIVNEFLVAFQKEYAAEQLKVDGAHSDGVLMRLFGATDFSMLQPFKKEFAELMTITDITDRQTAIAAFMKDTASAIVNQGEAARGLLGITNDGNVFMTSEAVKSMEANERNLNSLKAITEVIPNTKAAAAELKESLQNMMPKPSQAEAAMSGIESVLNQFSDSVEDGNGGLERRLKVFSKTEEGLESISQVMSEQLGIQFELTDLHKEDAQKVLEILETELERLALADKLIDTATAFSAALKTQVNMVKFLKTSASKRMQIDLNILKLQQQIIQNNAKEVITNSTLVKLGEKVEENRERGILTTQTVNRELESQIDLLIAMKDPIEQLGKTMLESFDKSGIQNLTTLIDTMDLSEFGGDELINNVAKDMKKSLAKLAAESIMTPITDKLTPEAFKLNKSLNPAEQMLLAHKKHVVGLADVLNQHVAAMGATLGVKAPDISSGGAIPEAKGRDLYTTGGDTLPGGFKEKFKEIGGGLKNFLFGKAGTQDYTKDYDAVGEDGVEQVGVTATKPKAGLFGTYGGTDIFGIKSVFERTFGDGGTFEGVGKKLFGEDGMFAKIGSSLFGEDGLLSGLFSGGGGLLEGLKGAFSGIFGALKGAGGGIMSFIGGMFGMPTGLAKGGIIGDIQAMAKGGITGYNRGGIATQPTYLVGEGKNNEAVVPLPDNKSIPVNLGGATGSTNNTNISVNVSDGGVSTKMEADGAKEMASAINMAVLAEIEKQQRPGGLLGA